MNLDENGPDIFFSFSVRSICLLAWFAMERKIAVINYDEQLLPEQKTTCKFHTHTKGKCGNMYFVSGKHEKRNARSPTKKTHLQKWSIFFW